jgi:hypothetical protein
VVVVVSFLGQETFSWAQQLPGRKFDPVLWFKHYLSYANCTRILILCDFFGRARPKWN